MKKKGPKGENPEVCEGSKMICTFVGSGMRENVTSMHRFFEPRIYRAPEAFDLFRSLALSRSKISWAATDGDAKPYGPWALCASSTPYCKSFSLLQIYYYYITNLFYIIRICNDLDLLMSLEFMRRAIHPDFCAFLENPRVRSFEGLRKVRNVTLFGFSRVLRVFACVLHTDFRAFAKLSARFPQFPRVFSFLKSIYATFVELT